MIGPERLVDLATQPADVDTDGTELDVDLDSDFTVLHTEHDD